MGDHCTNLVLLAERRWNKEYSFKPKAQAELVEMLSVVNDSMLIAVEALGPDGYADLADAKVVEAKINKLRDQSRKNHAVRMQDEDVEIRSGLLFYDMMTNLEKIGDYSWNVSKGLHQQTVETKR
jgi:phosphate:Na+ symporter